MADLIAPAARDLKSAGLEAPLRQAQDLLAGVLKMSRVEILTARDLKVTPRQARLFRLWIQKRRQRVPLQYLLGWEAFADLRLRVGPGVLIPRPETELLLQEAVRRCPQEDARWLADLGTGSGNLALALAGRYPRALVFGVDISPRALQWARRNRRRCGFSNLRFLQGNADHPIPRKYHGCFSLVVSNPPYIPTRDVAHLQPEVRFEPRLALDGGEKGTDMIRHMARAAARLLHSRGIYACEIGIHQSRETQNMFAQEGFTDIQTLADWQGIPRIVSGARK